MQEGHLVRWPDAAMPIQVYIAPFTWYEKKKQQQSQLYRQVVLDAMQTWHNATNGLIRFNIVSRLDDSQIDLKWRRVDRRSLGHCRYEIDPNGRLFSASIEIGISDGVLHAQYEHMGEVQHTILHEIGHALGLIGHSDQAKDIMYVPHQYGVSQLSPRDRETMSWLYQLPLGFNYKAIGPQYRLKPGFTMNDVINAIERRIKGEDLAEPASGTEPIAPPKPQAHPVTSEEDKLIKRTRSLDEQHDILSQMGRFHLTTQHIRLQQRKPPPKP
jgi:predicted Zn-dependent protease